MKSGRIVLWALLAVSLRLVPAAAVAAEMGLEILSLRHHQAAELLPAIRPFLVPGATATGMNEKLFLRTTPANADEIRRLLDALDRAPKRLVIHVRRDRDASFAERGGEIAGDLALGGNARIVQPSAATPHGGGRMEIRGGDSAVTARVWDTRSARSQGGSQTVQVVAGGRAFIQVGISLPVPLRQVVTGPQGAVFGDTVIYRDIGQGFYAEPRLNGDRVTLEISQQSDTPAGGGAVAVQRLATTVSGRLGEWIRLGATALDDRGDRRGDRSLSTREATEQQSVWLRVEELP